MNGFPVRLVSLYAVFSLLTDRRWVVDAQTSLGADSTRLFSTQFYDQTYHSLVVGNFVFSLFASICSPFRHHNSNAKFDSRKTCHVHPAITRFPLNVARCLGRRAASMILGGQKEMWLLLFKKVLENPFVTF
ncbi:hypothetical protein D918_04975 [Trichuris suis]|nr:hypothetical protein D918_04975 [Trichuris suis]